MLLTGVPGGVAYVFLIILGYDWSSSQRTNVNVWVWIHFELRE